MKKIVAERDPTAEGGVTDYIYTLDDETGEIIDREPLKSDDEIKCKITDMHQLNPAVPVNKSWDVNGMYVPNTDNGLIPSIKHQIRRLQSQVYRDKRIWEKYPNQLKEAKYNIGILQACLEELK